MTAISSRQMPRSVSRHTTRLTHWGGWLAFALLTGHLVFCHGCHGDEDNELCIPPTIRWTRNPKLEIRKPKENENLKPRTE
jgi:hypothetical protein